MSDIKITELNDEEVQVEFDGSYASLNSFGHVSYSSEPSSTKREDLPQVLKMIRVVAEMFGSQPS